MTQRLNQNQKQDVFFSTNEMPERNWAWAIEARILRENSTSLDDSEWFLFRGLGTTSHYRSEAGANAGLKEFIEFHKRKIELGVIEFRVVPKYVGYVPDADEAWIKP